ncbi:MAG: hypothetical protein HYU86_04005 [Chloroflexi bacterium]|nr:hypothetical protein [Chloroflexota bacterium]
MEAITGPYDLIVALEGDDLNAIGGGVTEGIQRIAGVKRTTTCLVVNL